MDQKLLLTLSYVFTPLVPLYVLFLSDKKDSPECKFHGWHSLLLGLASIVTCGLGWFVCLFCAYKLYTSGEEVTLPMLTDFARQQANK
jgi:uncharacterized membrane protein